MTTTLWLVAAAVVLATAAWSTVRPVPAVARAVPAVVVLLALLAVRIGTGTIAPGPAERTAHPPHGLVASAPDAVVGTVLAAAVCLVGILAGSAVTGAVLGVAMRGDLRRGDVRRGTHGGILVSTRDEPLGSSTAPEPSEVLRGGSVIGFLERFAIVGAALVGHLEIVAAVIAVKGLGRFSELDSPAARERFIVGTLTSTCWAGLAAAVVLL
ncbi:hypothetical protein JOE58_000751 [Curtobacterium luteum]|uniref:Uncharacterized protein n=1 Tax=Curtobacterium luteum TaxID=33881 RepID=A0A8H9G8M8_9MICO|nr:MULTISPECIES: hypothetical protein [Curtobacterium]MBM7801500.1 hypothetical protein [Curtobacterium luteum]NUU52171.1 hypothetical protein [Curtobacterium luteum]GGK89984.1 hypothetical protein GCM10009769_05050 [Curtobacterium luteum]